MGNAMQSRRTFVKDASLALGGAAAAALGASKIEGSVAYADEVAWDEEFDVIVAGAGIAGCATAVTLATEGEGVSVLLVEKGVVPSGNSPYCDQDVEYAEDEEGIYTYFKSMCGPDTDVSDEMLRAHAKGLTENWPWVESLGGLWEEAQYEAPGTADNPRCNSDVCWPELEGAWAHGWFALGRIADMPGDAENIPGYKLTGASSILDLLQTKIEEYDDAL